MVHVVMNLDPEDLQKRVIDIVKHLDNEERNYIL